MSSEDLNATILSDMHETYVAKNSDYGDSFNKTTDEFGLVAPVIRMNDKLNRFKQLALEDSKQQVTDESQYDTLIDLANYAVLTAMYIKEHNK